MRCASTLLPDLGSKSFVSRCVPILPNGVSHLVIVSSKHEYRNSKCSLTDEIDTCYTVMPNLRSLYVEDTGGIAAQ